MMRIAIIGEGYVGTAMKEFFADHYELVVIDVRYEEPLYSEGVITHSPHMHDADGCDLTVVCLPTPRSEDGTCDTSLVEKAISTIKSPLFLIKSTIEPGTTDRLKEKTGKRIVFSPEYCGESTYWTEYKFHTDVKETPWFTFGGDLKDTEELVRFFIKVVGPTKTYHQTDAITAELAKYVENTFYAMKITFCYEIAELSERMGVDYYKLREAWLLDPRVNPMHTAVFQENEYPYSGKCLPKDVSAIASYAESLGYDARLIKEILLSNDRIGELRKNKKS